MPSDPTHTDPETLSTEAHAEGRGLAPPRKSYRRRGIYLLPNLFTTAALFGGFYAIIMSMQGKFGNACPAILVSMICDSLDGRVARMTKTNSEFGKEYDSLADMVSFGVSTAVVVFAYSLHLFRDYTLFGHRFLDGQFGWTLAFLYALCAGLRLARFNVMTSLPSKTKDFFGLPSPAASALVVFFVWAMTDEDIPPENVLWLSALITFSAAALMVSNIRYNSFKAINLSKPMRFASLLGVLAVLFLIKLDPPKVLFGGFLLYAVSGPVGAIRRKLKGRDRPPAGGSAVA